MKRMTKTAQLVTLLLCCALLLCACGSSGDAPAASQEPEASQEPAAPAEPVVATFTGTGTGMGGDVTVEVELTDGKITNVTVKDHAETAGISDPALEQVPAAIIAADSADVDVVAGATLTSNAIIDGVKAALTEAGR